MPLTTVTETVPFNFAELQTSLNDKLIAAGYDTSPGSNVSQLTYAMAYLISMLNVNTAVNINETILSLATKRDNVLSDARALGYEIQHIQSYVYDFSITNTSASTISILKHSSFTDGIHTYYYMGTTLTLTAGASTTVSAKEGTLYMSNDYLNTLSVTTVPVINESGQTIPQYFIDVPFVDVEENGIECFVTYYNDLGTLVNNEPWTKAPQFMIDKDTIVKNMFFRQDDIVHRAPRVYFSLAGAGTGVRIGSNVNLNVLTTNGVNGVLPTPYDPATISTTIPNVSIDSISLAVIGTNEETISSIKQNAPKFYNSANRAVTANDYTAYCNRQSAVADTVVWGGNDEMPKSPGQIWFSFLPSVLVTTPVTLNAQTNIEYVLPDANNVWDYNIPVPTGAIVVGSAYETQYNNAITYYNNHFLIDNTIRAANTVGNTTIGIWDSLNNYKIPTIVFQNRHPVYVDFEVTIQILKYNVVTSKATIHNDIFNTIDSMFTGINDTLKMQSFMVQYFHSTLEKRIDTVTTDASGFNSSLKTSLLLTAKNVSAENSKISNQDIFIPLSMPFENYLDTNGAMITSVFPNIDTAGFIDARTTADINNGVLAYDIYTDWSSVTNLTANAATIVLDVPIRAATVEHVTGLAASAGPTTASTVNLSNILIQPDDINALPTYTKTSVTIQSTNGTTKPLTLAAASDGFSVNSTSQLTVRTQLAVGDTIVVQCDVTCGSYTILNGIKPSIVVQLYIDGSQSTGLNLPFSVAKSSLTSTNSIYTAANATIYLTTGGYTLTDPAQASSVTGDIYKTVTDLTYSSSPIKSDLFNLDRHLNLTYNSPNFAVTKNVIPRLKRVLFI